MVNYNMAELTSANPQDAGSLMNRVFTLYIAWLKEQGFSKREQKQMLMEKCRQLEKDINSTFPFE